MNHKTFIVECTYCGFTDTVSSLVKSHILKKCLKCSDTNLRIRDKSEAIIDTYIGCSPFQEPTIEEDLYDDYL